MAADAGHLIEYTMADGVRAAARFFFADEKSPVLVCMPAMGVRADYYIGFARSLSLSGLNVVLSDLRGIGSSSVRASRTSDFGYREILEIDIPALVALVAERFPHSPRVLLGHSLGGQLSALFLSANPDAAQALVLITSGSVYFKGWQSFGRLRVLGMAVLLRTLGAVLGHVPGEKVGFAGNEARRLVIDWSNNCFTGRYAASGSDVDYEGSLRAMRKPVLALSLEDDDLASPGSVRNLLGKLAGCRITHRPFATDHPGLEKAGHFSWAKRPGVFVDIVRDWVVDGGLDRG